MIKKYGLYTILCVFLTSENPVLSMEHEDNPYTFFSSPSHIKINDLKSFMTASSFDEKLRVLNGKNLSSFPLTEKIFNFIVEKVGADNKRKFAFKAGPQIIFEDEMDLLR